MKGDHELGGQAPHPPRARIPAAAARMTRLVGVSEGGGARGTHDLSVRTGHRRRGLALRGADRAGTERQSPLLEHQALDLAHRQMHLPAHQRDPGDQVRSHLPGRHPIGDVGGVPLAAPAARSAEQLVLGDDVPHLGKVSDLMTAVRLLVEVDRAPAAAGGGRDMAKRLVDLARIEPCALVLGVSRLGALRATRPLALLSPGALRGGVGRGWLRGRPRTLATLGKLLAELLVLGQYLDAKDHDRPD